MAPRGAPARRRGHARVIPASAEIIFSRAADRPYPEYDDLSSCVSCRDVDWTTVTTRVDFLWRTALVFPLRAALYAEREGGGRAAAHHALFFSTLQALTATSSADSSPNLADSSPNLSTSTETST